MVDVADSPELDLQDEPDARLIKRLIEEYLDVFAAHPTHRKHAKVADIPGIARRLAELCPELSTGFDLRKAAENLADRLVGWPSVSAFAKALTDGQGRASRPAPKAPIGWRWRRGVPCLEGVSPGDWYVASLHQEADAKKFLTSDIDAQALVKLALDDGWLSVLYWFTVERSRLPSPHEQIEIIAISRRADAIALEPMSRQEAGRVPLAEHLLALRQAMHDYAARQLGLPARPIA